jgi:hypothetical protein
VAVKDATLTHFAIILTALLASLIATRKKSNEPTPHRERDDDLGKKITTRKKKKTENTSVPARLLDPKRWIDMTHQTPTKKANILRPIPIFHRFPPNCPFLPTLSFEDFSKTLQRKLRIKCQTQPNSNLLQIALQKTQPLLLFLASSARPESWSTTQSEREIERFVPCSIHTP